MFCSPEYYVDSSRTTWANEEIEIRHTILIYDISAYYTHSEEFTILWRRFRDDSFYNLETNVEEDFERTGANEAFTT